VPRLPCFPPSTRPRPPAAALVPELHHRGCTFGDMSEFDVHMCICTKAACNANRSSCALNAVCPPSPAPAGQSQP
jgi:hypothetical protein